MSIDLDRLVYRLVLLGFLQKDDLMLVDWLQGGCPDAVLGGRCGVLQSWIGCQQARLVCRIGPCAASARCQGSRLPPLRRRCCCADDFLLVLGSLLWMLFSGGRSLLQDDLLGRHRDW